ncbi:MAG TPA: hypothetical protein PLU71_04975 [Candidatus Dependentiae bacterium]|nr:hypothetical protein [Candidatus Dependentiae bacterium]HRQ63188.1 hypothetical protein [Candidatus Dependentiae bacterium]
MLVYRSKLFCLTVLLLLSGIIRADNCNDCCGKVTSHTFYSVRPQFQVGSPEYLTLMRRCNGAVDEKNMNFNVTLFGGKTTKSDDIAKFFSPFCSECINVNGAIEEEGTALLPQHFNLFSVEYSDEVAMFLPMGVSNITDPFVSRITLRPEQSVIGLGFSFLAKFEACKRNWFFAVSAPLMRVKNDMGLCEVITSTGQFYDVTPIEDEVTNLNQELHNMTQALNQSDWCFGKICCGSLSKTRLAFIQAMLGLEWASNEHCFATSFLGITIPTGNKPEGKYIFEPIVGTAGHWGLYSYTTMGIEFHRFSSNNYVATIDTDIMMQYLFSRTEKRSMDLKYKPWSRYMELYKNKDQAIQANDLQATSIDAWFLATPGINILTQDVKVKPGYSVSLNVALTLNRDPNFADRGFTGEIGYNFYAREAECVELECCSLGGAAIKDHSGRGFVNPVRTMTNDLLSNEASVANQVFHGENTTTDVIDNYDTRALTIDDLDLNSAAHPCVLSNTVYAALGYDWADIKCPVTAGVGGSYEFAGRMNTSLDRWLIWGKLGIDF